MDDRKLKHCPVCKTWFSGAQLIDSSEIVIKGMCFDPDEPSLNQYLFCHEKPGCRTTFSIPLDNFADFIFESIADEVLAETDACEHHCVKIDDLEECGQACHYAPYRRFLIHMLAMKKEKRDESFSSAQPG